MSVVPFALVALLVGLKYSTLWPSLIALYAVIWLVALFMALSSLPKGPSLYTVSSLVRTVVEGPKAGYPDGTWVPARSEGSDSLPNRIRLGWLVFTGKADAVTWPKGQ